MGEITSSVLANGWSRTGFRKNNKDTFDDSFFAKILRKFLLARFDVMMIVKDECEC